MPGYEILDQNRKTIESKFICPSCKLLLRDPAQTSCGHYYCRSCIDHLKTRSSYMYGYLFSNWNFNCIVDTCGLNISESKIFSDELIKREVLSLQVNCLWQQRGCQWRGEVRDFELHNSTCANQQVTCVYGECGMVMDKSQLVGHLENECTFRLVSCQHCNEKVTSNIMAVHHQTGCPGFPVSCQHCRKTGIPRGKMEEHLDALQGDCEVAEVCCPYKDVGCPNRGKVRRSELTAHLNDSIQEHLGLVLLFIRHFADKIAGTAAVDGGSCPENNRDATSTFRAVEQICTEISNSRYRSNCVDRDMKGIMKRLQQLERKWEGLQSISDSVPPMLDPPSRMTSCRLVNANDLQKSCEQTESSCRRLHEDLQRLRLSTLASVTDMRGSVVQQGRRLDNHDKQIAKLESKMETSNKCEFIWKVTDVRRWTRVEVRNGNAPLLISPSFCTSHHGYKMCMKLCLDNSSSGSGAHISLSFVIMRGEFDALLRWPFQQKVTMMLLDQDNTNHVTHSFMPGTNSASFRKPTAEMNIASSCPMFCPLSELESHAYVRDDTMFIKVIVDTSDL